MNVFFYRLAQCTWGGLQSLVGLMVYLVHRRNRHFLFHGAVVTEWENQSSVSLGMFVFVTKQPYFVERLKKEHSREELAGRLLVHEYGHTIQSLFLGPLYLLLIGVPSSLWGFLPWCAKKRRTQKISYFSFFTEKWANALGEWVTGEPSMEQLVID